MSIRRPANEGHSSTSVLFQAPARWRARSGGPLSFLEPELVALALSFHHVWTFWIWRLTLTWRATTSQYKQLLDWQHGSHCVAHRGTTSNQTAAWHDSFYVRSAAKSSAFCATFACPSLPHINCILRLRDGSQDCNKFHDVPNCLWPWGQYCSGGTKAVSAIASWKKGAGFESHSTTDPSPTKTSCLKQTSALFMARQESELQTVPCHSWHSLVSVLRTCSTIE